MTRIAQGSTTRAAYIDRNPFNRAQNYSSALVAPAGATARWTYTVPAGKKAILESMHCELVRDGVAGTPAEASTYVAQTPSGGAASILAWQAEFLNTVESVTRQPVYMNNPIHVDLLAGDAVVGTTADGSTGGTYALRVAASIFEYDA